MWAIAKELKTPLDPDIKTIRDIPYTISYVIRKRMQIDNLKELPKEKQPPDLMIWLGTSEEVESWIDRVLSNKQQSTANLVIREDLIEQ